jgi:Methyltransferase domain
VIASSRERIERETGADALVLDAGGWARPLSRADWVIDLGSYDTRARWGRDGEEAEERFSRDTWVQRDLCARDPWPFADGQFDFAVCAQTLEDLRDPVWVCSELERVARAGYVEVPAPVEELTWGVQGPWVGWGHHRWLFSVSDGGLEAVHKPHLLPRSGSHLPAGTLHGLSPEQRTTRLWWRDRLACRERIHFGAEEFDAWLDALLHRVAP